jgi:glycosyltransferase involved in cell wall biosynthesis
VSRLIADGENGLLVTPGSIPELQAALARLLTDDALCDRLRRAGRRTVEQRYSFATRMARLADLYDDLLAHDTPGKPRTRVRVG